MTEQSNPFLDGYGDAMRAELEALPNADSFHELLYANATLETTLLRTTKPMAIELSQLPAAITEAHHMSDRFIMKDLDLTLTTEPRSGLWALNGNYEADGNLYQFSGGNNGMTLTTENLNGDTLRMPLSREVCYQFLASIARSASRQQEIHELLAFSPETLSASDLRNLLEDIASRFGVAATTIETDFEHTDSLGNMRIAHISLAELTSPTHSIQKLRFAGGFDAGSGLTEIIIEQTIDAESGQTTTRVHRGGSEIPADEYILESQIFGTAGFLEEEPNDTAMRSFATFALRTLNIMANPNNSAFTE